MTVSRSHGAERPGASGRANAIAYLVAGAFFMENLDATVIVTALPQMAESFGVQPVDLNIGVSAYLLTLAVLIPVSGWVADRFGARTVFGGAIVVFTLASILCGLSQSLGAFTAARILQGAAGAMMVPVGRLIVLRNTAKEDLIRTIATITWPALVAPVLGPPVGGFITTYASWHWIFFLNVPLGLIGLALAWRLIPAGGGGAARPFDGLGFVLTGLACFGLMYGLDLVSREDGAWPGALACLAVSLVLAVLAVRHARRAEHPMLDLWALRLRSFAVTIWGGSLFRMAINAVPFLLPLMFQIGFGLDAFQAGLLVLAVFAGNLTMKLVTTRVLRRFRFRTVLLVNGLLNALTLFACAFLTPATPFALIAALLFLSGLTRSMQFTALNTIAFADVPQPRMSGANTLFNVTQQMAMGLGIALGALALRLAGLLHDGPAGPTPLVDFQIAFVVVALVALLAVIDVVGLGRDAGDNVRAATAR
ncbi:MFS transporter [Marinivivus vitaminiproducens]|uniref:MFS transporter n=1 Tax=Marinivivus vitaminiproducens TaxID=3035935 RepID=UPI0027A92EB5|nr:MFS transporter [Geminicoccaceae bacterium SCSIO 64248]